MGLPEQEGVDYSLELTLQDKQAMLKRLAKAVVLFQDHFLEAEVDSGSLCQVWLPEQTEDGQTVLKTKGLPFCVAGMGDLLALFRCISTRYCFGTSLDEPELLGAPGRVLLSREPEMSRNVQKYSKDVYLRASEAQQCRVHSTLVIPLFRSSSRRQAVGVLEVVQTIEDMPFDNIVDLLNDALGQCGLYTCDSKTDHKEMASSMKAARSLAALKMSRSSSSQGSGRLSEDKISEVRAPAEAVSPITKEEPTPDSGITGPTRGISLPTTSRPVCVSAGTGMQQQRSKSLALSTSGGSPPGPLESAAAAAAAGEELGSSDEEDFDDEDGQPRGRRGRGTGNPGKPGKKLKLEHLQSQFGVGLKEAAQRLGICATTLKRACRRHGIQRWPRRQLLKLSKAIDQINATGTPADAPGAAVVAPTPDNRWTTLAQLIPGISVSFKEAAEAQRVQQLQEDAQAALDRAASSGDAAHAPASSAVLAGAMPLGPPDSQPMQVKLQVNEQGLLQQQNGSFAALEVLMQQPPPLQQQQDFYQHQSSNNFSQVVTNGGGFGYQLEQQNSLPNSNGMHPMQIDPTANGQAAQYMQQLQLAHMAQPAMPLQHMHQQQFVPGSAPELSPFDYLPPSTTASAFEFQLSNSAPLQYERIASNTFSPDHLHQQQQQHPQQQHNLPSGFGGKEAGQAGQVQDLRDIFGDGSGLDDDVHLMDEEVLGLIAGLGNHA